LSDWKVYFIISTGPQLGEKMKKNIRLISFFLFFLLSVTTVEALNVKNVSTASEIRKIAIEENFQEVKLEKNDSIDGTTSASQLRAKKSHYVSTKNETILSVSLGVISIGIIIFFLRLLGARK
jgi:hypothetical protein